MKTVSAEPKLLDAQAWFMGGSGQPIPSPFEVDEVNTRYDPSVPIFPGQPTFPVSATHSLFTPEGLYPLTGVQSLTLNTSTSQGVTIINDTITGQIAAGNTIVVEGGSQSATIEGLEMRNLLTLPADEQPSTDQLKFVMLGDPSNPDGGLLERFSIPGVSLSLPGWGVTFSGATPSDTPWDTADYTLEYDGFADFPRYPIDLLSDLNALFGIASVHPTYPRLTDAHLAEAVRLPVSDGYTGHTEYFMIPTENLPLLEPLRDIPVLGNPLADLLQPDLKVLVNLGYGSIADGWDTGPANVATPFGLVPHVDLGDVLTALGKGAQQGVEDFAHDLGSLSLHGSTDTGATADSGDPGDPGDPADAMQTFANVINSLNDAFTAMYAALLPIANALTALTSTLPTYDLDLFAHELSTGSLGDAIGMPIAADLGLTPILVGIGIDLPIGEALRSVGEDLFHFNIEKLF